MNNHMRAWTALALLGVSCTSGPWLPSGVVDYELTHPDNGVLLSRHLRIETEVPTRLTVVLESDDHAERIEFHHEGTVHEQALLGLLPDRTYRLSATLDGADGDLMVRDRITTSALPELWPTWELLTTTPTRMEPGLTLFAMRADGQGIEYYVVVDAQGQVRWLQSLTGSAREVTTPDLRLLHDGTLLATRNGEVFHTDLLGNTLHRLVPRDAVLNGQPGVVVPEVEGLFHHEVAPLPDGSGVYTLITNPFDVRGFPRSYTDPDDMRRTTIADDLVLEVTWEGTVLAMWSLAERLDTSRIGWDSLERRSGWVDWAHANAVHYDAASDAYIVTLRHQDAIVKLDRATGEVLWVMAPRDNWDEAFEPLLLDRATSDTRWSWHAHAAEVTPSGSILVFDNHNYANSPLTGTSSVLPAQNTSRLVEYVVDESAGTVSQVWQFTEGPQGGFFSPGMGDADHQPTTGNVLGVWGRMTHERRRALTERGFGDQGVRILEVTSNPIPEVLFDLRLTSNADTLPAGWTCNRAERIASLYPADVATVTALEQ